MEGPIKISDNNMNYLTHILYIPDQVKMIAEKMSSHRGNSNMTWVGKRGVLDVHMTVNQE